MSKAACLLCCSLLSLAAGSLCASDGAARGFALRRASETAIQYQPWELDFSYPTAAPFDPQQAAFEAHITTPTGQTHRVAAFWTRAHERRVEQPDRDPASWRETVAAVGAAHWRVRYSPLSPGAHQVVLRDRHGAADALWQGRFQATAGRGRGFLQRRAGHDYLVYSDGTGHFALGFNVCWPPSAAGVAGYTHYLDRLAAAGCTYTRLWLCTWGFRLETAEPYQYDLASAWQLDQVFAAAAARGIAIKLCLDNFHDFVHSPREGPYLTPNGPCRDRTEFFTRPAAAALYQAKLRYLVARYSAYTSLYAWELWNEMNYALEFAYEEDASWLSAAVLQERYFLPWTETMARALRRQDPYQHPVTTSLGNDVVWDELWQQPELDLVQQHSYIHYLSLSRDPLEEDAALLVLESRARLRKHGRPTLLAEFGYNGTNEYNPLNRDDPLGIALHNALWAGALSGHAGTPMVWWWDYYLERYDLYHHYQHLAAFLEGVDWARPKESLISDTDRQIRVLVLRDPVWAGVWIQDKRATWYGRLEEKYTPARIDDVVLHLTGFTAGTYDATWFDPWTGAAVRTATVTTAQGALDLPAPPFHRDLALRLLLQKAADAGVMGAVEQVP